ncbi:MAG: TlpA family protein disulfide reductase [Anaerolineae bacterium]
MKERILKVLKEDGLTIFIVVALIVAYAVLRTPGDEFGSMAELKTELAGGRPTVIEFYSNRCSICLVSKPKVDQMERDLFGQAAVLRLNVKEEPGRALAQQWGVVGVPTFFVLDGSGEIIYARAGAPEVDAIKEAVTLSTE